MNGFNFGQGGCDCISWIIIILLLCGCCGNGIGCCEIIIIILLLCCCCGNGLGNTRSDYDCK